MTRNTWNHLTWYSSSDEVILWINMNPCIINSYDFLCKVWIISCIIYASANVHSWYNYPYRKAIFLCLLDLSHIFFLTRVWGFCTISFDINRKFVGRYSIISDEEENNLTTAYKDTPKRRRGLIGCIHEDAQGTLIIKGWGKICTISSLTICLNPQIFRVTHQVVYIYIYIYIYIYMETYLFNPSSVGRIRQMIYFKRSEFSFPSSKLVDLQRLNNSDWLLFIYSRWIHVFLHWINAK